MKKQRYAPQKFFLLYGRIGHGSTIAEAKADAQAQVEQALCGSYNPLVISAHDQCVLVWRDLCGWGYTFVTPGSEVDGHDAIPLHHLCGGMYATSAEAEKAARFHLAQRIFRIGGPTGLDVIGDEKDRREHYGWCRFQYAYRAWQNKGYGDTDCHDWACWNRWPEGVEPWDIPQEEKTWEK